MSKNIQINAYSLTKLAQMFDANRETLRRRLELVQPIEPGRWTLAQVAEAYAVYERKSLPGAGSREDLDPAYERARKDKELADKAALENAVRRGELLSAEEVKAEWINVVSAARAALLSLPSRCARQLVGVQDEKEINGILYDQVEQVLTDLADGREANEE